MWREGEACLQGPTNQKTVGEIHATPTPRHVAFHDRATVPSHSMEDDRAATNLGPEVDEGIPEEPVTVQKQPKRRFVGRRAADKTSQLQPTEANANIEDSNAIQGVRRIG